MIKCYFLFLNDSKYILIDKKNSIDFKFIYILVILPNNYKI